MKKLGRPVSAAIKQWLVLNTNELAWIALLSGLGAFIGTFMNP